MIIVKLMGGLGNQMFQYALGRHLSYKYNTTLKLDISDYKNNLLREYKLNFFDIKGEPATNRELLLYSKSFLVNFNYKLSKLLPFLFRYTIVFEKQFTFNQNILSLSDDVYLIGYWASEKYFIKIKNVLKKDFILKKTNSNTKQFIQRLNNINAVSVHIRRGDYVNNKITNDYHGFLGIRYYQQAIEIIKRNVKNPEFFIFSDDIAWAERNIKINYPKVFINQKFGFKDYEELVIMSHCKHQIVANSTFSWWAAWLNTYTNKIVVAPDKWFNKKDIDTKDLIPESWYKV